MESEWRLNPVRMGMAGIFTPVFPSDGRQLLVARRRDFPFFYVTNLIGNELTFAESWLSLTGTWPFLTGYHHTKPNPHGNFPYGFDVDPDH